MGTTTAMLKEWFDAGIAMKATHMIVVCDTFEYEDYPVYVASNESVQSKLAHYNNGGNMQKVMEVYNLHSMTWEQQSGGRVYNAN